MIGMNFLSAFVLFIISVLVSVIMFFLLKIRIGRGSKGFIAEVCVGWFGGWVGWILEHWWVKWGEVHIVPAVLGAASLILVIHVLFPPPKE